MSEDSMPVSAVC